MSVAARRIDELFAGVLAPLVTGGELHPPRPIGASLAGRIAELADVFTASDDRAASAFSARRAHRARALWAVDDLPPPSDAEWRMAAALSDLLQVANPGLTGGFGGGRPARLLASIEATLAEIPPIATPLQALARHATFARLPELVRHDATVTWWTGSATFLGEPPPARLLAWPRARRVRTDARSTPLPELSRHLPALQGRWHGALAMLLARTPLTDLAWRRRAEPVTRARAELERLAATRAGKAMMDRIEAKRGAPSAGRPRRPDASGPQGG